jgi:Kazal-type serine protease inhibitor domain
MRRCLVLQLIAASALIVMSMDGAGAAPAGVGKVCGGRLAIACNPGLFCDLPAGTCGSADVEGKCVRVPRFCAQKITLRPVCGCDGKTYRNNCHRERAIVAKRHNGRC